MMFSFPKSFFSALSLASFAATATAFDGEARFLQGKKGGNAGGGGIAGGKKGGMSMPTDPLCPISASSSSGSGGKKGSSSSLDDTCVVGDGLDEDLQFGRPLSAPNVIFGAGNADGSWTKSTENGIELALRGKLRRNEESCEAENTFNRVGNAGYNFPAGSPDSCAATDTGPGPTWSYEFSINSDIGCDSVAPGANCVSLDSYDYHLQQDADPSYCTDFENGTADPINVSSVPKPDHAIGTASTKQGGGGDPQCGDSSNMWTCASSSRCNVPTDGFFPVAPFVFGCLDDSTTDYETAIQEYTVAQNSFQAQFFDTTFDFEKVGVYTFNLAAKCKGTDLIIAATSIDIIVGDLTTDFPTSDSACEGGNFSFGGIFASEEECKDFVARYA